MLRTNLRWVTQSIAEGKSFRIDIISNLPDHVLLHILSFLPKMKEVVKTSILSKRWRYVWTFVDKLVFDNEKSWFSSSDLHFTQFVYRILKLHKGNIKEFGLKLHGTVRGDEFDITSWINTAISRGVERLHVNTHVDWPAVSIFTCKLVDLKIWFYDDSTCVAVSIFHQALEHLIFDSLQTPIEIVSSSMKRLELHTDINTKIVLDISFLEYLKIDCMQPCELIVESQLSSLLVADIRFHVFHESAWLMSNVHLFHDSFVQFIELLSNVKVLRLDCYDKRFIESVEHGKFLNLTKLEIVSPFFEWGLLASLMESSNNLEVITLKKRIAPKSYKLDWKQPNNVPTCLSSSLKKISIDGYSKDELPMVKYVLETAQILEAMDICGENNGSELSMLKEIQNFPRASERCEISFNNT